MPRYVSVRLRKQWLQPPWTSLAFGNIKRQISSGRATQENTWNLDDGRCNCSWEKISKNPAVKFTKSAGLD